MNRVKRCQFLKHYDVIYRHLSIFHIEPVIPADTVKRLLKSHCFYGVQHIAVLKMFAGRVISIEFCSVMDCAEA